jgi:hypothetical protein
MLAVRVADYVRFARPLSAKWQTVSMPTALFRQAAVLFDDLLPKTGPPDSAENSPIAAAGVCD